MSSNREEWTDAEWAARCHVGDEEAWVRLAELFVLRLSADVARRWRHRPPNAEQLIDDAVQNLFRDLREKPERLDADFRPGHWTVERYLTEWAWRLAQALGRAEQRRHHHEGEPPPDDAETPRHGEIDFEDQAERLMPSLTLRQRKRLRSLLERTLSDSKDRPSKEALAQFVKDLRRVLAEMEGPDPNGPDRE